jgi:DNA-binding protein H-NS
MSKLTALKKQIAALEAQAERIAKAEMSSAIAKVKGIMAEFNLTIEHLTHAVASKRAAKTTKAKTKTKTKSASVAKYADPKTGKTWSGFGRAPGWIAGVKNRDAFLVAKSPAAGPVAKASGAAKKSSAKAAKAAKAARKSAKPAAKKAIAAVKQATHVAAAAPVASKKKPAAKKAAGKKSAPKAAAAKRASESAAGTTAAPAA